MCSGPSCEGCFGGAVGASSDPLLWPFVRCMYVAQLLAHRTGMVAGHLIVKIHDGELGELSFKIKRHTDPAAEPADRSLSELTMDFRKALHDMLEHASVKLGGRVLPCRFGRVEIIVRDRVVHDILFDNRIRPREVSESLASCMAAAWKPADGCPVVCSQDRNMGVV